MTAGTCIRHTELPHATRLFTDFVYDFDRVSRFYSHPPFARKSFEAAATQVRLDAARRRELVDILAEQNQECSAIAGSHLDRLADSSTLVVATGQQVGLYTGPIFTIYKALSAARLAASLTERGISCVPVFWLATEDHDLHEVNHAWVFDSSLNPTRLEASTTARQGEPVGSVRPDDGIHDALAAALADLPFGPQVAELAAQAYGDGATFGSGFRALLTRLLGACGLLVFDPLRPAVRRLAAPVVAQAIRTTPELAAALLERGRELQSDGYHVQVHFEEQSSLLFLLEGNLRTPLHREGDVYIAGQERYSSSDLLARLEHSPEDFSPNVLLRPVVQDYLLPTVAFIAGPAELAYLAQSEVIYQRLLGRMPVALPRVSLTLLDARADKLLARYGLTILDAMHGTAALEQHIADTLIPPALEQTFHSSLEQIETAIAAVDKQLTAFDPTLAAAWGTSHRKILYQASKIRAKAARESLRRSKRARNDAAFLRHLIAPERTLQERLYSVLPFAARHGLDLIDRLYSSVHFDCPDHQIISL